MKKTRLTSWIGIAVFVLLAVGAVAIATLMRPSLSPGERRTQELAEKLDYLLERPRTDDQIGVVIFALTAPAGDTELAQLCRVLCDALVERLLREGALRISSCASARVASEAGVQGRQLAQLLAVDYALEGSIARLPDGTLRTTAVMRRLRADAEMWRIEENGNEETLQQLVAQITRRVSETAGQPLTADTEEAIEPKAYARYLKAAQLFARKNVDEMQMAQKLIDEVLAVAPDYTPALYMRLGLMSQLANIVPENASDEPASDEELLADEVRMMQEIHALGQRLVAIDPGHLRGNILMLNHAFKNRQWVDAYRYTDALLQHRARHPGVLRINARLNLHTGYLQRAREQAMEAARLDPLNAETYEVLALIHGMQGNVEKMGEFASIAAELGYQEIALVEAMAAHQRRDWAQFEQSYAELQHASGNDGADWVVPLARALAEPSQREAAARLLDQQSDILRMSQASFFMEYALLDDFERSLKSVRRHAKLPPAPWLQHLWWPQLAPVRQRPEFAAAAEDLMLTTLWAKRGDPDRCTRGPDETWTCT